MKQLTKNDVLFVMSRVPKDVVKLMKEGGFMLAGGFIRETISGGKVNDIDLFGPDKKTMEYAAKDLALGRKGRMFETDNAFTVLSPPRVAVQFIHRWLVGGGEFKDYLALFDFTVCQAGIWWDSKCQEWTSGCHENFYADLAAKRLVYTSPNREEEAGGSLLRMKKFIKRGYDIQVGSMAGVLARVFSEVNLRKTENADEKWLIQVITAILREVDPLSVIDGVEVPETEDQREVPLSPPLSGGTI